MEWSGTVLWVCQPWPAASLSVGWGGGCSGPGHDGRASVRFFYVTGCRQAWNSASFPLTLSSPFPSGGHLVPRWNLSHCPRPPHKPGCKLGCSLSGRKNSLSLEPPCFRLSPLLKAKPAHHLQGLNFAERFLGGGLAGKGVGRALLWQRGALGCLGSTNLGSARHPNASHV